MSDPARDLISDLWWFIENVDEDAPDRSDRFFALRARVRDYHAASTTTGVNDGA